MRQRRMAALGVAMALAVPGLLGGGSGTAQAAGTDGVLFAAYASPRSGETMFQAVERLEQRLGAKLPMVRNYVSLGKAMDNPFHRFVLGGGRGLMVTFKSRRESGEKIPWRRIVAAKPSWRLYQELVTMADSARALGVPIVMGFHHEPEAAKNEEYGTSADFIAAWRKVVSIFRERGATNVKWVWTMTSWSFEVNPADRRAADKWYPGDAWVDYLGADPYNWNKCLPNMPRDWEPLANTIAPFMAFADKHPTKKLMLPEFGSDEGAPGQKAAWMRDARQLFKTQPYADKFVAVSYYHNNHEGDVACDWWLDSSPEAMAAAGDMARDTFFRISQPLSPSN